jgi:MFS family permease
VKTWTALVLLGLAGQLAWVVENLWFNGYVTAMTGARAVDAIAWMVAVSAATATLTTMVMGTLSDRLRRRKPLIVLGYVIWGITTALFPFVTALPSSLLVVGIVAADAVMTFFGSTANDAAFNAWVTDITPSVRRGRVEGVLAALPLFAIIITSVMAGIMTRSTGEGYIPFFFVIGGFVTVSGLMSMLLIKDDPRLAGMGTATHDKFTAQFFKVFRLSTIKQHPELFLVLTAIFLTGFGDQIYMPYIIPYMTGYLGLTQSEFTMVLATGMLGGGLLSFFLGVLADKFDKRRLALITPILQALAMYSMSLAHGKVELILAFLVMTATTTFSAIVITSMARDLMPPDQVGQFQGVRMVFYVALPMMTGPFVGNYVIKTLGVFRNGQYLPGPSLFVVAAGALLLTMIPVTALNLRHRTPHTA